jgi:integrase
MDNLKVLDSKKGTEVRLGDSVVKINPIQTGRYTTYRLTWYVGDKRFRVSRADKDEAITLAKQKVRHLARAEGEHTKVDAARLVYLLECEKSVAPHQLHKACAFFRKFHVLNSKPKSFAEICDELVADLKVKKLSKDHEQTVNSQVKTLKSWFPKESMAQITPQSLERKLRESHFAPYTQHKLVAFYRTIENFAKKRRYFTEDHQTIAEQITLMAVPKTNYPVFTPEQLMKFLIVVKPKELAYVATMAFGGGRRNECTQMTKEHFNFEEKTAHIDRVIAKKTLPRHLYIPECLFDWLKLATFPEHGPIMTERKVGEISRDVAKLKQVGLAWEDNILRHSFLSYHLAAFQNPNNTAYHGGTSIKMLSSRYVALVSKRASEEWFNITPEAVRAYAKQKGLTGLITW